MTGSVLFIPRNVLPKICQKSRDHERSQRKARHRTETDQPEGEGICLSPLDPRPTPDPTPSPAPAEIEVNPSGKTVRRRLDDAGLPLVCWSRPQITWRDVGQSLWPQKARTLRTVMTWDWLVFLSWHSLCVFFHFCCCCCCCDSSDMRKRRFSVCVLFVCVCAWCADRESKAAGKWDVYRRRKTVYSREMTQWGGAVNLSCSFSLLTPFQSLELVEW